jgi:hypothetical protein
VARCGGDQGVSVDELIVREKRGEEEKGGALWGLVLVALLLTFIGIGEALGEH